MPVWAVRAADAEARSEAAAVPLRRADEDSVAEASPASSGVPLVSDLSVDRFYSDLVFELGEHARSGGTAIGAAAVAKRVALAHGVASAGRVPLPRFNRAELVEMGRAGVSRVRARGAVPRGR
jgi:hypothetical protein